MNDSLHLAVLYFVAASVLFESSQELEAGFLHLLYAGIGLTSFVVGGFYLHRSFR